MSKIKPHIEMKTTPLNNIGNVNDPEYDSNSVDIYNVFISDRQLKILFSVAWRDPDTTLGREFQVIRPETLYLDSIDYTEKYDYTKANTKYPLTSAPYNCSIASDPTIVNELFSDVLTKYGIVLKRAIVHNMNFFESKDYTFTDDTILEELYDLINNFCKKVKHEKIIKE